MPAHLCCDEMGGNRAHIHSSCTTIYPAGGYVGTCGINLRSVGVITPIILTPLPDIAAHIVDTQFIRRLGSNRVRRIVALVIVPSDIINTVAATIQIAFAFNAALCGKFPLSLCRQAKIFAGNLVEFFYKVLTIVPAYALYR